ncbi:hypothetical protein [Novipirellula caenicola]|uniref:Uncharacterized protein n=1 Tax=Novipirellula caenicola TaxID=1536901 RepID=A0ABP9VRE2_9BACT
MKNVLGAVLVFTLFLAVWGVDGVTTQAAEPGWSPIIIPTGAYRQEIKSMPIEQRPYRPGHFYGNTVRRLHYRGEVLPRPSDLPVTQNIVPTVIAPAAAASNQPAVPNYQSAAPTNSYAPVTYPQPGTSNPPATPNTFGLRRLFSGRNRF